MENVLVKNFNNIMLTLATFGSNIAPESLLTTYKAPIEIIAKNNSTIIIDYFVLNVLINYEDQIMNGDDAFFISKDYSEDLKGTQNLSKVIFEFKNIWTRLNDQNKITIKTYMKTLCKIARAYSEILLEKK